MKKPDRRQAKSGFFGTPKSPSDNTREPEQFELLPPPEFNPVWPTHGTNPKAALDRMLTGERITQPSFGTNRWRLAAYVKELDYLGWPVKSEWVKEPGYHRPIKRYWLDPKTILAARSLRGAA
ncbi:hypothetical protein SBC1_24920 [Caballeronia sp. SBC1]|uniref:hypothetical protein n=1 Tax=Caballeronia sp. SBC1 TaxID=2705548 RepID=UPI001408E06E|nr:hypothetical protein [Caballeronia sp. SBC1]QIN62477.1 hypothetical protein SBC1_24920 [Caballeronia sp. SBC1]